MATIYFFLYRILVCLNIKIYSFELLFFPKVTIPTYRESEFDRKIILYGLEILKRGKDKFLLDKRYSEFNQLHAQLKKVFNDLPIFPSKTLFDISKNPEELEKRRSLLEKYLNVKHIICIQYYRIC